MNARSKPTFSGEYLVMKNRFTEEGQGRGESAFNSSYLTEAGWSALGKWARIAFAARCVKR